MIVALASVVGLVVGSFLNVVVHRVPRGESVVSPPSACPRCGHRLRARDNVPVLSWLVLRGRCRSCRGPISVRYPLVEIGSALAFGFVAARFGGSLVVLALLYLAAVSIALALIDFDVHRLPDVIVLPSYLVLVALLAITSAGSGDWYALLRATIGGTTLFAGYFFMLFIYPRGMGFGDVKLAGLLGLMLAYQGWGQFAVGVFAAFVLGGITAILLLVTGRAKRGTAIPFGPWMLLGAWVGIVVGAEMWREYLALVGLA